MKSFFELSAELNEGLHRQLGNGLHGNLRYTGPASDTHIASSSSNDKPEKKSKAPSPEAMAVLSKLKGLEKHNPYGVQPKDITNDMKLISQLVAAGLVSVNTRDERGNGKVKRIRSTED